MIHFNFENNGKGFKSLNSNLSKLKKKYEIVIGFESTGHYHQTLFNYLTSKKYKCYLINPYMTSKFRSISLRDTKNDNIDSRAIAQFLSFEYRNLESEEYLNNELKEPAREASRGKYSLANVEILKEAAKISVGIDSIALGLNIIQCIETLELKENQIDIIEKEIKKHSTVINSPLHQLTGINDIEIAYIVSAIISIDRFDDPKKLVAYSGSDHKIGQSRTWCESATKMSKRGSKILRYTLIWISFNVSKKGGPMKIYYDMKKLKVNLITTHRGICAVKLRKYIYWIFSHPNQEFKYQ